MVYNEHEEKVIFERCITFLNSIGIQTIFRIIGDDSFLPGFLIENGTVIIDKDTVQYPGDILHEAGHIAIVSSADRAQLTEKAIIKRKDREAEEVMAIAWSYAACMHLEIDPAFVFHNEGYRGGSRSIIESCDKNEYIGLFMLQSIGMAIGGSQVVSKTMPFPFMIRWLRN
ncbi:hypothetical protein [Chitinophaga sp.]|uniref:hypothetical protein n=1 Tax=Chitinophaga sp. TaxID=1869181 RepID=UPI0031D3C1FD